MSIRIFLIDEHRPSREMLARRLASCPEMEVVGNTDDAEDGLRRVSQLRPDLVLLDVKMKNADGMAVCRRACSSSEGVKVAVLTSYTDPEERRQAYQAGASGYLLKEVDTPKLAQWISLLASATGEESKA
jgi:DNA-binding NarL/FixJ family response regulator